MISTYYEDPSFQSLEQQYAALFTSSTDIMNSFFVQQDHMQVFKFVLNYNCLESLSCFSFYTQADFSCWLAKALRFHHSFLSVLPIACK